GATAGAAARGRSPRDRLAGAAVGRSIGASNLVPAGVRRLRIGHHRRARAFEAEIGGGDVRRSGEDRVEQELGPHVGHEVGALNDFEGIARTVAGFDLVMSDDFELFHAYKPTMRPSLSRLMGVSLSPCLPCVALPVSSLTSSLGAVTVSLSSVTCFTTSEVLSFGSGFCLASCLAS